MDVVGNRRTYKQHQAARKLEQEAKAVKSIPILREMGYTIIAPHAEAPLELE